MQALPTLANRNIRSQLKAGDLGLRVGPYTYSLRSDLPRLADGLSQLYADFPAAGADDFIDYTVALQHGGPVSRMRRRVHFLFENQGSFAPIPISQAYAFLEWGMNWCVSVHANEYLKLHAAVVARNGRAIVMPGVPGQARAHCARHWG
jgi:hypothetical protein